jgi:hypothetical protein
MSDELFFLFSVRKIPARRTSLFDPGLSSRCVQELLFGLRCSYRIVEE